MKITSLDGIYDHANKLTVEDIINGREIEEIDFSYEPRNLDDYGAGFDIILKDGERIKVRVSCMPSADTAFYIQS